MPDQQEDMPSEPRDASYWHDWLQRAYRHDEPWLRETDDLLRRYRVEKSEWAGTASRLPIFSSNVELLKPAVYSQSPVPDVRRRVISEDPMTKAIGREAAILLERALGYAVDSYDFDSVMEAVRDDMLILGRGVAREIYEVTITRRRDLQQQEIPGIGAVYFLAGAPVEPEVDKDGPFVEVKEHEAIRCSYVYHSDYRQDPSARSWADVRWVAFRHVMTRRELVEEFGDRGKTIPLTVRSSEGEGITSPLEIDSGNPSALPSKHGRAEIWEVWDKDRRERVWVAKGEKELLRVDPDPLGLAGFFPMACPLYGITTNDSMLPCPELNWYKELADEIDELQSRIRVLEKALKAFAFYEGDASDILKVSSATDGALIPIERPAEAASDLANAVWWWPVQTIVQVIAGLSERIERLKLNVHEITGISDLQRGSVQERESASASRLKSGYGQLRMTPRSLPMARFVRDTLRIKAEIMAEMFDPQTLEMIGGAPVSPPVLELLRTEKLRNTQIVVATDATVRPDVHAEREEATEFLTAVTGYLGQAIPMAMQAPMFAPLLLGMLKETGRVFKHGRNFEAQIDQLAAQIEQQAQQQQMQQQAAMQQQAVMMPQPGVPQ